MLLSWLEISIIKTNHVKQHWFVFTVSSRYGPTWGNKQNKQETIQHYQVRKVRLWTFLENFITLMVPLLRLSNEGSKQWDGRAECWKVSKSEPSLTRWSTWGAKTKEPSLPVRLWELRLWSGPERESSLMKYWCFSFLFFFFNCVLWELGLLSGCTCWTTLLLARWEWTLVSGCYRS